MIYLYAYTNHRADLDALRRMGALWKMLDERGIAAELLVNDYRAQLAGRELGLPLATTIETIYDIDAVASYGDRVVIDTPEAIPESLLKYYREHFGELFRIVPGGGESLAGERVIDPFGPGSLLVDSRYRRPKGESCRERRVLIFRDSDPEKELLKLGPLLAELGLELYWGAYFYVKYEETLAEIFGTIHESEEYAALVEEAGLVVTAMPQTALEAAVSGARTIYLRRDAATEEVDAALRRLGVEILPIDEAERLKTILSEGPGKELRIDEESFDAGIISE
ncbi:hypothetical protein [Nitratifractor sp.]